MDGREDTSENRLETDVGPDEPGFNNLLATCLQCGLAQGALRAEWQQCSSPDECR
jgi:hypothetical protein